jgi:hypothetical protein
MENVIVIRDPKKDINSESMSCICVDRLLGHANPACKYCRGTGQINHSIDHKDTENQRLTTAEMCFENALTIWDDEDEIPLSDILAYFTSDEDIQINDIILHKGKRYVVLSADIMHGLNGDLLLCCALERVSQ